MNSHIHAYIHKPRRTHVLTKQCNKFLKPLSNLENKQLKISGGISIFLSQICIILVCIVYCIFRFNVQSNIQVRGICSQRVHKLYLLPISRKTVFFLKRVYLFVCNNRECIVCIQHAFLTAAAAVAVFFFFFLYLLRA